MFRIGEFSHLAGADIPAAQLRDLLAAKQAELDRRMEADRRRLRLIASRIDGIDNTPAFEAFDLRAKTLGPVPWISHRFACTEPAHAFGIVAEIITVAKQATELAAAPYRLAVAHGDFTDTDIDLQAGVIVRHLPHSKDLALPSGALLTAATLLHIEAVTGVRLGLPEFTAAFYAALGRWLAANDAEISGPVRELFLQIPEPDNGIEPVVEVQFPIRHRTGA